MVLLLEEDVLVNQDAASHVHLCREDDLSSMDEMMFEAANHKLVVRCTGMPTQSSTLSRVQHILLKPQFTEVTILLSNGVSQLPLDVFSTVFASKHSIERLQLLVSGRSTSTDGLVALLGCWKGAEQELPHLTVGCTWHHPRPAAQWSRLNHALQQLEGSKIGTLELEKVALRTLPSVRSLELSLCHTATLPQPNGPTTSLVLQPLPQAVPGIVQWLKSGALPNRLGLDVYRLAPQQMEDLLQAVIQPSSRNMTLAILGVRHLHHMQVLIDMLPRLRVQHLEVEYMDHAYMRHQWPTHQLVVAVQANWHLPSLALRRRTAAVGKDAKSPPLLDAKQRTALQLALHRNQTVSMTTPEPLGHYLHVCPDVSLVTTWLLHAEPVGNL